MKFEGHLGEVWVYSQEDATITNLARHLWDTDRVKGFLLLRLTPQFLPTPSPSSTLLPTQVYGH